MLDIAELLESRTGIQLARGGVKNLLGQYVLRRRAVLGNLSAAYYLSLLRSSSSEFQLLVNAATVVYTWFYRDSGQFAAVSELIQQLPQERAARIWVPACATGEDAYTIALIARHLGRRCEILGTDINTDALRRAELAQYSDWSIRELPGFLRTGVRSVGEGAHQVVDEVKQHVRFEPHNLAAPPKMNAQGWDLVLCRNVLIYFERERARRIFYGLASSVSREGYLMLGASEVIVDVPEGLSALYVAGRPVLKRGKVALKEAKPTPISPRPLAGNPAALRGPAPQNWPAPVSVMPPSAADLLVEGSPPCLKRHEKAMSFGHDLLDAGELVKAKAIYLGQVREDETNSEARMYAGITHYLCGEVPEAAQQLRAALFLRSDLWPAAFYLALAYESMGLLSDAVREYRHMVRLSETDTSGLLGSEPIVGAWYTDLLRLAKQRSR